MKWKMQYQTIELSEPLNEYVSCPSDVSRALNSVFNPIQEELYCLILNTRGNILAKHLIGKGGNGQISISPCDIFRTVLLTGGNRIILAHNHPAGQMEPSREDIVFTEKVQEGCKLLGLQLLDHIIYSATGIYSMNENHLL